MSQLLLAVILMRMSVRTETEGAEPCFGVITTPLVGFYFGCHSGCVVHKHTHTCQRSTHVKPLIHMAGLYIKHGRSEEQPSADGTPNS